jgi:uracil-DNA glycosylase
MCFLKVTFDERDKRGNIEVVIPVTFLQPIDIHPSWKPFFEDRNIVQELQEIEEKIGTNYTPATPLVLRFATVDLKGVHVIWLGKDVYPQEGVATGRCFEVAGVKDWNDKRINSSLKNIIKLLHKTYTGSKFARGIEEVRHDIETGKFPLPAPDKAFSYWERQGVLFLNTAFTCEVGKFSKAGSHLKVWKTFFQELLTYIATENQEIRYFLWGDARRYAKQLLSLGVTKEQLYESKHPCTNGDDGGYKKGTNFLNNPCFLETKDLISWIETE